MTAKHKGLVTGQVNMGFGGGVLFFARDVGAYLWLLRSDEGDAPGTWCCPGGGIEDYETIDQGVRRECLEEIGYAEPFELLHMHRNVRPGYVYHNHIAVIDKHFIPVLNDEHDDYIWALTPPGKVHPYLAQSLEAWVTSQNLDQGGANAPR